MYTFKASQALLDRSVLKNIKSAHSTMISGPCIGGDAGAVLMPHDSVPGMSGSCAVREVVHERSVKLAVYSAAANIYASGAEPAAIINTITIPQSMRPMAVERTLNSIAGELKKAADYIGVPVIAGHTAFAESVTLPQVSVTVLGSGNMRPEPENYSDCSIVMAGYAGMEGTIEIYSAHREELEERFSARFLDGIRDIDNDLCIKSQSRVIEECGADIRFCHDISESGIFGALWELSEYTGCGLKADLKKLLLKQETIELCELYEINPYVIKSAGAQIIITPDAAAVTEAMELAGIRAVNIGRLTQDNEKIIINDYETRYLEPYRMPKRAKRKAGGQ